MANPQMMVVVKVQDHDELQSIQIYPISSDSVNEDIMVASYGFQEGRKTCMKIMMKYPGHPLPKKFNNSEILLPDDELCPCGWNNTVLKFFDQVTGDSRSGLSDEDHCIEIDHPYKSLFPVIREVLEDLSTDVHWENHEEMVGTYESPAYQAYEDERLNKNPLIQMLIRMAERIASTLPYFQSPIISEDQSAEKVECDQLSNEDTEAASREVSLEGCDEESRGKTTPQYTYISSGFDFYGAFHQDHSSIDQFIFSALEFGVTDLRRFQNLALGERHHRSIKGLAKVVMGVSATANYGSFFPLVKVAYAAAFIASLVALWLPCKWKTTTRDLTKFGAIACAAGVLATLGYELPPEYIWVAGLAFIVPAAGVALS